MNNSIYCRATPNPVLIVCALTLLLWGCEGLTPVAPAPSAAPSPASVTAPVQAPVATTAPTAPAPAAAPPPPVQAVPIDDAILNAANTLFSLATQPPGGVTASQKRVLVIDPLVDGVSGAQSTATRSMGQRIVELAKAKYPQFEVLPFHAASIARNPIVLVGTFTPVNKDGQTAGERVAYRICLAMADLSSRKILAKGVARAQQNGVDITPSATFRDSPAWIKDPAVDGYIKTCQATKPGDPIDPVYLERIQAATLISEAINAYDSNRYEEALGYYRSALQSSAGDQLRVHNGVYLSNWKLGRRDEAAKAFGKIVDYGIAHQQLAVKFLFQPGSTQFWPDPQITAPYRIWLNQLAQHTAQNNACLNIVGHTSRTGSEPINDRLSLQRAQVIKQRLDAESPALGKRTKANGVGSRENLIGTATDDMRDALDRRVEFKVVNCA